VEKKQINHIPQW